MEYESWMRCELFASFENISVEMHRNCYCNLEQKNLEDALCLRSAVMKIFVFFFKPCPIRVCSPNSSSLEISFDWVYIICGKVFPNY